MCSESADQLIHSLSVGNKHLDYCVHAGVWSFVKAALILVYPNRVVK